MPSFVVAAPEPWSEFDLSAAKCMAGLDMGIWSGTSDGIAGIGFGAVSFAFLSADDFLFALPCATARGFFWWATL